MIKPLATTAAVLLAATVLVPAGKASATAAATTATCGLSASSVTAAGDHDASGIVSTVPPKATSSVLGRGAFAPGQVKVMASMSVLIDQGPDGSEHDVYGYVIIGDVLYQAAYGAQHDGTIVNPPAALRRIGGGWGNFTMVEEAEYQGPTQAGISRWTVYGLRNDGVLFRWTVSSKGVWRSAGSAAGFAAVKSMALVSKAATYDTFVANTRGGALYTIHIPTSSPMKPVVKQVRSRTWQGFETLLTQKCGVYGTVLLGIDKDTDTAYLYAVGRFTGTSTVIQSLGKVPAAFADNVYARLKDPGAPLTGE
ncbi:hypothetical protein GCM10009630_00460 [Kribbella jejuensis]|uniref:Uncharacterized protein n=1 Tax=Kribbella jejuensis TaxID=236068 RepID=A0A542E8E5_9ACTN|nr:hypothetical protein [Kribbella jejuensis]TQJ11603.1 hypothetical protein FB475_4523 [Kribbella jejuensis]